MEHVEEAFISKPAEIMVNNSAKKTFSEHISLSDLMKSKNLGESPKKKY